ncbi:unnamed protein product [Meloidogyne enterolobii]|uniref:Uncharacterized protein n=1 Tax=Meloidogyne enterolobii TaxID=390850 RepID=A0ACB0YNE9_MELEN
MKKNPQKEESPQNEKKSAKRGKVRKIRKSPQKEEKSAKRGKVRKKRKVRKMRKSTNLGKIRKV